MVCSPANKDNTGLAQKKENKGYLTNHSLCHYFLLFEILMGTVSNGMVHFSIDDNVTSQTRYSFKLIYPDTSIHLIHQQSVQIRSFFWFKYRKTQTRKNSVLGHSSRSVNFINLRKTASRSNVCFSIFHKNFAE